MTNNLEQEIKDSSNRISKRSTEIDDILRQLDKRIAVFTRYAWSFVFIGFLVTVIGVLYYLSFKHTSYELNLLGDFLSGSVASLWSLAGLFFIYVAFLGQKQQLLNQQLEIMFSHLEVKYTRLELKEQKKEMIEQNNTMRHQRFENTFFQLLKNHQEIVNSIDIRNKISTGEWTISQQGRDCFKTFYSRCMKEISSNMTILELQKEYMKFYTKHQSDLGHYFRNLYHILKFINEAEEIQQDKKFTYTSILRASLSSYELALLFYNCLGEYGIDFFKPLVEKYSFLKNLDKALVTPNLIKSYDSLAFASSNKRVEILKERSKCM